MTIDDAIRDLAILESRAINNSGMFKKDALKLGISALDLVKRERRDLISYAGELLEGETEKT